MSELDPLTGYSDVGPTPTYNQYNRMKKSALSNRNCRLTILGLFLIGAALTAAVVFLVLMDPPEAELVPADPATESLLQMKFPIERGYRKSSTWKNRKSSWRHGDESSWKKTKSSWRHRDDESTWNDHKKQWKDGDDDESAWNDHNNNLLKLEGESDLNDVDSTEPNPETEIETETETAIEPNTEINTELLKSTWKSRSSSWKKSKSRSSYQSKPTVDVEILKECTKRGWEEVNRRKAIDVTLVDTPVWNVSEPAFYHQLTTPMDFETAEMLASAVVTEVSLQCLRDRGIDLESLQKADFRVLQQDWPQCQNRKSRDCSSRYRYRTLDGSCNNLKNPFWGASHQPFRRLLPAEYEDGLSLPKPAFPKGIIPPARQVSICMQNATNKWDDTRLSMLFVNFAHFLDHDLSFIPTTKGYNRTKGLICCGDEAKRHPECFPLEMKSNDPFYKERGLMCMDFVRSAPAAQCKIGVREQVNQASAYIDLSNVYSTTEREGRKVLRDIDGGYMRSPTEADGRYMLLRSRDEHDGCNRPRKLAQDLFCFKSGDSRVNEFFGLTVMNQVWMREHNRVTDFFIKLNPHWDDERLYQETRRIVIAEMQHVVFNEFLPLLLGEKLTNSLGLAPLKEGYYHDYDANTDTRIANSFATSAFRFFHSMQKGMVAFEGVGKATEYVPLHETLFNPYPLFEFGKMDEFIRGSASDNPRPVHTSFSSEAANHLFQVPDQTFGFDLFAIDIQRGRDHGLPPYYRWREVCNLPNATTFEQMKEFFRPHSLELIQRFYVDGTHLDLFTGMLAENPLTDGGILGPMASCIIADQFVRLKRGDRFYYETADPKLRFTPEQLETIRNVSFARILCENGDAMDMIQDRAFEAVADENPKKHCSGYQIPRLDLTRWKEV